MLLFLFFVLCCFTFGVRAAQTNATFVSNITELMLRNGTNLVLPVELEDGKQPKKKSVIDAGGLLIPPPPPAAHLPPPAHSHLLPALLPPIYSLPKFPGSFARNIYTRVKMGYGTFYYNGRDAELRCNFPYNLKINSNFVWNKVTDNMVHLLDVYRVYERTHGHTSSLYVRDVQAKDFGIYACAVSGSFYPEHPVTFYQEVYFFPPVTYTPIPFSR